MKSLSRKRRLKRRRLEKRVKACQACPGLNLKGETENAPGYGNINASILIIGQSLCHPCMATQIPFTGGSGRILDEVFDCVGIRKDEVFITNTVHCHPPKNRPSSQLEIDNCRRFLIEELRIVKPKLVLCLGRDASFAITSRSIAANGKRISSIRFRDGSQRFDVYVTNHPAYHYRFGSRTATDRYVKELADIIRRYHE